MERHTLTRRQAIRNLALGMGAVAAPAWVVTLTDTALAAGATAGPANGQLRFLDAFQNETVRILSELIIPETDTPGAAAARVNEFIDLVLSESDAEEQDRFVEGLAWLDERSLGRTGEPFREADPRRRLELLESISRPGEGFEFFQAVKSLTVSGYYTSEIGYRQELGGDGVMFFADYKGSQEPDEVIEQWLQESLGRKAEAETQ